MSDKTLDRLVEKVDDLIDTNRRQDIHLEKLSIISEQNKEILDQHISRTEANERRILFVEKLVEKHLSFVRGAVWVFAATSTISGLVYTLTKLLR